MFQGSFYEPYFMDTNVTFSLELFSFQQLFTDFTRNSTGGSLSWGYRLLPTLHAAIAYNLEQVSTEIGGLSGRKDVPIASLFNAGLTSSLRATITFDNRDDRWMPSNGWYLSGTAEYAAAALGSENLFSRYIGRVRRYFPKPLDGVLKFNLVGGVVLAPEGRQVPLFERFFMGGIYNVRGFQRNTLGPSIGVPVSGDPGAALSAFNIGGNKQLYLNNEFEMPLVKQPVNLRALVFFDIGNAFGEGEDLSLEAMRMSFGWGVRWFSPVGPLRFEWGVPIAPQPGEDPLVFAFTIGQSF
jgi:outer membrane protein insertion porin family